MSKYNGLSHIYPKDIRAIGLIAKTGAITAESLDTLGITNNRKNIYLKSGLIKPVNYVERCGKLHSAYVLTDLGKSFCKSECGIKNFISNGNSTYHNQSVSDYMANHLTKQEIDSSLSERQLSEWIQDRLIEIREQGEEQYQEVLTKLQSGELSRPDIIYKTDTQTYIALEISTSSYSQEEINTKLEFTEAFGIEIVFHHV